MTSELRLTDDISDDGDLAMLAVLSSAAISYILNELCALPLVECNAYCRKMAEQILDGLGPCFTDWERGFCNSILRRIGSAF